MSNSGQQKRRKFNHKVVDFKLTDLPDLTINLIFVCAGGVSALSFGQTCKALRKLQPPLRVLIVDELDAKQRSILLKHHNQFPRNVLQLNVTLKRKFNCGELLVERTAHHIIESIPPIYAREITHLYFCAIHLYVKHAFCQFEGPALLLNEPIEKYGRNLASLHTLVVVHPIFHPADLMGRQRLGKRLVRLCKATASTLRALKVCAFNGIVGTVYNDAKEMLAYLGNLNHLDMKMHGTGGHEPCHEENTFRLQCDAVTLCPYLKEPAQVLLHKHRPSWYFQRFSNIQFNNHSCIHLDQSNDVCFDIEPEDHPKGYSGKWCGGISRCTEGVALPPLGTMPTKMYSYTGLDNARFAISPDG